MVVSHDVVVEVYLSDVLVIHEAGHLFCPVVPPHGCHLPRARSCVLADVRVGRVVGVLLLFEVLQVALDLVLELVKGIGCLAALSVVLGRTQKTHALLFLSLLHEDLDISQGVLEPRGRGLAKVDPQVLQVTPVKLVVEL